MKRPIKINILVDFHPNKHNPRLLPIKKTTSSLPSLDFNEYSEHILFCTQTRNNFSNSLCSSSAINVITVPPKIWKKKPENRYTPILYNNIDIKRYVFKSFGKSIKRSLHFNPCPRSDLIFWDKLVDKPELVRDIHIWNDIDPSIRQSIINIIQEHLYFFCERGVSRPILDFEFYTETSNIPPMCCRLSVYGFHEKNHD